MNFYIRYSNHNVITPVACLKNHDFVQYGSLNIDTLEELLDYSDLFEEQVGIQREELVDLEGNDLGKVWVLSIGYFE